MLSKALNCFEFGDLDNLEFCEINLPEIKENEVLIKVAACGINFPDLLLIENKYQFKPELPFVPGGEVSGIVLKVGNTVKRFKLGQRVFSLCTWGGLSDLVVIDESRVFELHDSIDFLTGATLMYNYSTSLFALNQKGRLMPGETLLVLGAGGGVGMAALELGKIMGAKVIAAASKEKLEICKLKNPDYLIDYNDDNFKENLKDIIKDTGIDVIFDPVGGDWANTAFRSLNRNGRYLVVGFASGIIPAIPFNLPLLKSSSIIGVFWGDFSRKESLQNQQNLNWISTKYLDGAISPFIGEVFSKQDAIVALKALKNKQIKGKAVVIWDKEICSEKQDFIKENIPKKLIFENFNEVKNHIGQELGESQWLYITQNVINEFGLATQDTQWIHINPERAKMGPLGVTIAHGWLTVSLSPFLLAQIFEIKNSRMGINYGADKIRFLRPIKKDSKIKLSARLLEATDAPNNGLKLKIEANYYTEDSKNPACVAEYLSIIY